LGKILSPPSNFPQSDLGRRADSRWALPQISSSFYFTFFFPASEVFIWAFAESMVEPWLQMYFYEFLAPITRLMATYLVVYFICKNFRSLVFLSLPYLSYTRRSATGDLSLIWAITSAAKEAGDESLCHNRMFTAIKALELHCLEIKKPTPSIESTKPRF